MSHYLIMGRAGSGKSSIATEFAGRGYPALDTDEIEGLARWEDLTGRAATLTDYTNVDLAHFRWTWNPTRLAQVLAESPDLILCGSADNDLAQAKQFDQIFVLDVSPDIQANRLATRTNSDYGRSPEMIPRIVAEQQRLVTEALALGAIAVDADQPISDVVNQVLACIDDY